MKLKEWLNEAIIEKKKESAPSVPESAESTEPGKKSKRNTLWDNFTTLLTIGLVLMAIYCSVMIANQKKTGELFFPFGYRPIVILSGSMEETLKTGAIVIVKQTKEVSEDDIIFFVTEEGSPVIHRYIDTDENGNMITKGDNNPKEDLEHITPKRLQGKVVVTMNWMAGPMNFFARLSNKLF